MPEEKLLTEALSPTQLRAKLEEMVVNDLLGPAESADEELDERSVRDRYLVGVLAPRKPAAQPMPAGGEDEEFPPVLLDELEEDGAEGENAAMEMLYRRYVEFAVGHGVSVRSETSPGVTDKAVRIRTQVIPAYEVCRTTPPTVADAGRNPAFGKLAGLVLDMRELAEADPSALPGMMAPLVAAYDEWIVIEAGRAAGLGHHQAAAGIALDRCRESLLRIQEGLALLDPTSESYDAQAVDAFQFMNRAMWWQRTRSIFSEIIRRGEQVKFEDIDVAKNRSWYPFQIAFIFLNMPGGPLAAIGMIEARHSMPPPICSGSPPAEARPKVIWGWPPTPWDCDGCKASSKAGRAKTASRY